MKKQYTSPHLSIYSFPLIVYMSIFHRFSGFVLMLASLCLAPLMYCITHNIDFMANPVVSWLVKLFVLAVIFSFCYHVFSGLRHLFLDMGYGFSLAAAHYIAYAVLIASLIASGVVSYIIFWGSR